MQQLTPSSLGLPSTASPWHPPLVASGTQTTGSSTFLWVPILFLKVMGASPGSFYSLCGFQGQITGFLLWTCWTSLLRSGCEGSPLKSWKWAEISQSSF